MQQLSGKTILITGASSGIGEAAAKLFAAEGANLVLGARRETHLARITEEITADGGKARFLAGDLRDESYVKSLTALTLETFGALDAAFNNAGTTGKGGAITEMAEEDWHETLDTNLTSAFLCAKHQLPALVASGGGSLIFTSSFVGPLSGGMPGMAAYAAAKAGLVGLAHALASEYGAGGVRVNALLPGGTDTPIAPQDDGVRAMIAERHALKRMGKPEEVARAALFLASDAASFVTGTALRADGGVSITF